jgi:hypothetical protein
VGGLFSSTSVTSSLSPKNYISRARPSGSAVLAHRIL